MNVEEYKALRAEILTYFRINSQYMLSTVIATGVILGIALSATDFSRFLLLAPLIVIIPNALHYAANTEAVIRIATYIQVFGERESNDLRWETRLYQIVPELRAWAFNALHRFFYTLNFLGLGMLCIVLFLCQEDTSCFAKCSISILAIILLAIVEYRFLYVHSRRPKYLRLWRALLDKEKKSNKQ